MRTKYELDVQHVTSDGETTFLDMSFASEPGDPMIEVKIGRGTEVLVDLDDLAVLVGRFQAERS